MLKCPSCGAHCVEPSEKCVECGHEFKVPFWKYKSSHSSYPSHRSKKPIYKNFWFYVIVIPVFLYVIGNPSKEDKKTSKSTSNESETLYGLTEQTRRKFFKELVAAEDRALAEADIARLRNPPKANIKKWSELEEKYIQEVRQKYNITKEIEKKIVIEGIKENWPMPPH